MVNYENLMKYKLYVGYSDLLNVVRDTNETGPSREFRAFTANKIWTKYPYKDKIRTCSL